MKNYKYEFKKRLYVTIVNIITIAAITSLFLIKWMKDWNFLMDQYFRNKGNILMAVVYIVLIYSFFRIWGGLKLGYVKLINLLTAQSLAVLCTNILEGVQIVLMIGNMAVIEKIAWDMVKITVIAIAICLVLDLIFVNLYARNFPPYRMIQINGAHKNYLNQKIKERDDKYVICEEVSVFEDEETIFSKIQKYDAVLLNDIPSQQKNRILKYCFNHSVRVYFTPKISDIIVKGTKEINLFDSPLFLCKNIGLTAGQRIVKRTMDIVFSLLGLILASPFMLLTAICIKAYDGGPVFYKQERCTYGGKVFWIYKFRSMIVDAEKDGKSRPATDDDIRITPVGRFIRKTRIDELPQLINILKGDMSIVGPRPERVEHIEKYSEEIPEFTYRLKVKGGLTGYAQVYGKYNTTALDKLKMDLIYIVNYSILLDFQILFETVKIVFQKESTKGFTTEQTEKIRDKSK